MGIPPRVYSRGRRFWEASWGSGGRLIHKVEAQLHNTHARIPPVPGHEYKREHKQECKESMSTAERAGNGDFIIPPFYVKILDRLWRGKGLIILGTLVCAVTAAIVSLSMSKTFEASTSLLLFPPPFKGHDDMSSLMPRTLGVPDYEILLKSDGVLRQAADIVRDAGTWEEEDLASLEKMSKLRKRMRISVEVTEKSAYRITYSPVIVLSARGSTAEQAADLANAWAQVSEDLAKELYLQGKTGLKKFIDERFDANMTELQVAAAEIRDVEIEYNDELQRQRLGEKHARLMGYEKKRTDLLMEIESTKAEIVEVRADFEEEPEYKYLWKSPPMTALFLQGTSGEPGADPTSKQMQQGYREEIINSTHMNLKHKLLEKERELSGLQEHERQLAASMEELEADLQALREEVATRKYERKMLDMQETPLRASHDLLAGKLEQAKIAESEQENLDDIKIVSRAVVPDKKIRPARTLMVLVALVFGFCCSCAGVLLQGELAALG